MKHRARGEGSIFFSDSEKCWIAELVLPDGRKKRKRSKLQKTVKQWLDDQKEALNNGLWVSRDTVKYGEFLDRYMSDVVIPSLRLKTQESYDYMISGHIKPEFGEMKLVQIRPEHLQGFYAKKLNAGFSKRTVQYLHSIIHKSLDVALKWGLIVRNVADSVSPPQPDKPKIIPLSVEEVKKLLGALEDDRLYAFYVVACATGMRRGELLGLQKSDVNLEAGTITVNHSLGQIRHHGLVLGEPKSDKSRRVLALPDFALEALKTHLENQTVPSDYVFCTSNGTPFAPRNILRHFKTTLNKVGLPPNTRIHDIRHAFISWLLASGTPPKDVQMIAGHSQFAVTMDLYGHLMPGAQKEAAKKIEGMFRQ